jgi:hypothetical protein
MLDEDALRRCTVYAWQPDAEDETRRQQWFYFY